MKLQAIETRYNGYRFRSRTEARWAVFLDVAGSQYEYESQGFVLPDGTKYLPDFELGKRGWLEAKKAALLAELSGLFVMVVVGAPWPTTEIHVFTSTSMRDRSVAVGALERIYPATRYAAAYEAARSARFEHGETPTA